MALLSPTALSQEGIALPPPPHNLRVGNDKDWQQRRLHFDPKTVELRTQYPPQDKGTGQPQGTIGAEVSHGMVEARDAIVVTASYVDDCLASRLRHLVESSRSSVKGVHRDVWIVHSHFQFDERYQNGGNITFAQQFSRPDGLYVDDEFPIISDNAKLLRSRELIANIPELHVAVQSVLGDIFDSKSGSSKTSFLKFMNQHDKYRFGWLVEDDMFYTGQWGTLFDALDTNVNQGKDGKSSSISMTDTVDVLSVKRPIVLETDSWWDAPYRHCFVDTGEGLWPHSIKKCKEIDPTVTSWAMIRVSAVFASSLLRDLFGARPRSAIAHNHEPIVGAYSKVFNFTVQTIPWVHIGMVDFGGYGKWLELPSNQTSRLEHHGPIHRNKLYHPVKCSAYPPGGIDEDLNKWATDG